MGLVAALVVTTLVHVGSAPTYDQPQTWDGPTMADLSDCATMAQEMSTAYRAIVDRGIKRDWQERWVTCEIYPSDDEPKAAAAPAALRF